ncbi:MAG: alginate lyase family protein, partial [Proteobacteria bacterium]|nr:alginate lyase family protein [Pseudomonadota bacterium]
GHDPADKNWNTWRVAIRAAAAQVLNDKSEIQKSMELIHKQIYDNFVRDSQGETDGTSVDFVKRDALHYHVYNMRAWLTVANLTPCSLSVGDRATIQAGLEFLNPYYLGKKQHIEFEKTKIDEDRARGKAGDQTYQPHVWKPLEGDDAWLNRTLIRWARPSFPAIRSWTKDYVDSEFDASDKFLAKLWGEPENSN